MTNNQTSCLISIGVAKQCAEYAAGMLQACAENPHDCILTTQVKQAAAILAQVQEMLRQDANEVQ